MQTLNIRTEDLEENATSDKKYHQHWIAALLTGSTSLISLTMVADGVPWTLVLGLSQIRHLDLTIRQAKPWLGVLATDLSLSSCLETLKITDGVERGPYGVSKNLPDLLLHDVASLKTVELCGWYPEGSFTLPSGCLVRLAVRLREHSL